MAYIRRLKSRDDRPQVRWRDPVTGEQLSRLFDRMSDARAFKAKIETDMQKSTYVDPRSGKVQFDEWAAQCSEARLHLRPATRARDESYMRNHVIPAFGKLPLVGITKLRVQAWVRKLHDGGLAPATVRECHRLLHGVLSEAVEARLIAESPCRNISLPRIPHQEQRYLTPEEVERLTDVIEPSFRALIYCAVYLGCPWGELVGLKRHNLHLLKREVRIVGSLEEVSGGPHYVEETKTSASRRTLSIPPLSGRGARFAPPRCATKRFVFTGARGALLRRSNFRKRQWQLAVQSAELDPELRFHDLRHSCASILIAAAPTPRKSRPASATRPSRRRFDRYGHLFPSLGSQLDDSLELAFREPARGAGSRRKVSTITWRCHPFPVRAGHYHWRDEEASPHDARPALRALSDSAPRKRNSVGTSAALVSSAVATNATPQRMAATAPTGPRLEEASGFIIEVTPNRAGRRPATHAVSLQPLDRRLAKTPTPMTVKLNAAMNP
jgi:integrase